MSGSRWRQSDSSSADLSDLDLVDRLSEARWISLSARKSTQRPNIISLIICRSLDIFGGTGVKFDELVEADKRAKAASS